MACTQEVAFGVNLIGNDGAAPVDEASLTGWAPVGSRTTLSTHVEQDPPAAMLPAVDGGREHRPSGRYVLAARRDGEEHGLRHAVPVGALVPRVTYRVAGWVAVHVQGGGGESSSEESHVVRVNLHVDGGGDGECRVIDCGAVCAGVAGGWVEIKGAFRLKETPRGATAVHVHGAPAGVGVKVMDLRVRKRDVVLKFSGGAAGLEATASISGASVRVVQMDNVFPLGTCINSSVIQDPNFVDFFTNNFDWAVFENELKWYWTEAQRGQLNYRDADALLDFCDRHGKPARGHCIFWAVDGSVQQWIKDLGRDDLASAVHGRLSGLLSRYAGRFPHYDVNNEMLHGRFYRDRLGDDAAALMFREAARLDPGAQLFVNDYNVECANDPNATPEKYMELIDALRRGGAAVGGVGIQGHVSNPSGEVICDALDKLATTGLPIWITELDVSEPDVSLRADDLEVVLREAYAHPAVAGVVLWGFMQGRMWRQDASLVDADGTVNEAGQRLVNLRREWTSDARGTIDGDGNFRFRGYHGTYVVQVTMATGKMLKTFTVDKGDTSLVLDMEI
uniref:GH10 domain-containing protein n=1 Tax=Oryza punctata TaxID=4537 RepID=A0A0E0L100_ORYPU